MKACGCVLAAVSIAVVGCSAAPTRATLPAARALTPKFLRVKVNTAGRTEIRRVPLEDYVRATIISEFAPGAGDTDLVERMLEVQAVISRTYALAHLARHERDGFDLCSTTHCQLFEPERLLTSRWAPAASEAIRRTDGQVLWYGGAAASALFHADCGGHTSRSSEVWAGAGKAYLVGMADDGPAEDAHATWQFDTTIDAVRTALNADPRTQVGAQFDGLTVLDRDQAGRAQRVALHSTHDRIVRGEELREVLSRSFGPRSLKSTWFEVRRHRNVLHFEGRGFGHGVGLCQAGALACLRAGVRMSDVLRRYFPGTTLVTLD
jgi:stage II sporulation protein D